MTDGSLVIFHCRRKDIKQRQIDKKKCIIYIPRNYKKKINGYEIFTFRRSLKIPCSLQILSVCLIILTTIILIFFSDLQIILKIVNWSVKYDFVNIYILLSIRPEIRGKVRRSRNSGCVAVCLAMEAGCESKAGADNVYEPYNTEKTETNFLSLGKW